MKYQSLFAFFLLLSLNSCLSDEEVTQTVTPPNTNHIQEVSFLDCTNHQTTDLSDDLPNFNNFIKWNDLYFFDAFDEMYVRNGALDGETIIQEDFRVNRFVPNGNKMMICAAEGIYEVDETGTMTVATENVCFDMVIRSDGKVIFTTEGNQSGRLHLLDDGVVFSYSDTQNSDAVCTTLEGLVLLDDENIYAITCDKTLIHFKNGVYTNAFDKDDYELPSTPADNGFYVVPYNQDLIVVAKNGTGYYQIMKYTADDGEWIKLKLFTSGSTNSQQDVDMILPSLTDALIHEDKLYVSTTLASCLGIHEFEITKNSTLTPGEYGLIRDPGFPTQCIDGMIWGEDGNLFVISGQSHITEIDCN